jgi:hypothetical protein
MGEVHRAGGEAFHTGLHPIHGKNKKNVPEAELFRVAGQG